MKIVLGGGGSAEDEADVLAHFASLVHRGRVLNLPWAQSDPAEPRIHQWVEHTLSSLGVREVTTVSEVSAEAVRLDESIDGIFIGGGNTFRLLARLRSTGVARVLAERAEAGLPCYGGSAGAIILGAHVGTCAHLDRNEVGLRNLTGLNLCGGRAIWCHYDERDADRLIQFVRSTELEVFSLPENSGLRIGSDRTGSLGPGNVSRWTMQGSTEIRRWNSA
jgi:dipeptidase E